MRLVSSGRYANEVLVSIRAAEYTDLESNPDTTVLLQCQTTS